MSPVNQRPDAPIASIAPSGRGFIALLVAFRATGGTAPSEAVTRLLEDHAASNGVGFAGLVHTGQVFGFEWRATLWVPMFQFHADDLSLRDAAQQVRAALPAGWSGWTRAAWFAAPSARLAGLCPADGLASDPDAVVRAAQAVKSPERFEPAQVWRPHAVAAHG